MKLLIVGLIICIIIIVVLVCALGFCYDVLKREYSGKQKVTRNFKLLNWWFEKKIENEKFIPEYLSQRGYKSVAIYGFGYMGELLYKDMRRFNVAVDYIIDNTAKNTDLKIFTLKDELPKTDAIIVAVSYDYESIEKKIKEKTNVPVVFLEEMLQ